nr:Protein of uncharacterised function (DUF1602) [Klebsiella pneumoniae]
MADVQPVVGSSSSIIAVSWASTIAIHARCRWPPESVSTLCSARSLIPVARIALFTASSSSLRQRVNSGWCG